MHYVAIDLETTGLNASKCSVLEIAMVLEDTLAPQRPVEELPTFHAKLHHSQGSWWEPAALEMNLGMVLEDTKDPIGPYAAERVWTDAVCWMYMHLNSLKGRVYLAGKNVGGFDSKFLPPELLNWFHYRYIEVGSAFVDWGACGGVPSLGEITGTAVRHRALEDARDVVRALRKLYSTPPEVG